MVLAATASVDWDAPSAVDRVCVAAVALLSLNGNYTVRVPAGSAALVALRPSAAAR